MSLPLLIILATGGLLAAPTAVYEQKQGPAVLRLDVRQGKDGRVEMPLAGTILTVRISGKDPVQATWDETRSPAWKMHPLPRKGTPPPGIAWEQSFDVEPTGPRKPGELLELKWTIRYRAANEPERTAAWTVPVRITTEIQDPSLREMRPGTPPEQVPPAWSWREPGGWALLVLILSVLLLLLGDLIGRIIRRHRMLLPAVWARRELERLAGMNLSLGEKSERFPGQLSDIVRRYLELRFRLPASRQTTGEFLAAVQSDPQLTAGQKTLLQDLLQLCDLAKFARASLSEKECRDLLARARKFVNDTAADRR